MAIHENERYQNMNAFSGTEKHIPLQCVHTTLDIAVSNATIYNWKRLNQTDEGRLLTRANKTKSTKKILPLEYFSNQNNIAFVQDILNYTENKHFSISSVLLSLSINLLKRAKILSKRHVKRVLNDYVSWTSIPLLEDIDIPTEEFDLLGLIYQSYLLEGKKTEMGSYYTPKAVAVKLTSSLDFSSNQVFLDPCCGSGAILLATNAITPNQLYGIDWDEIAVFLAKINLLLKYRTFEFEPRIYCLDYLAGFSLLQNNPVLNMSFDYIITNPPWGASNDYTEESDNSIFKETFSVFFIKAFRQLNQGGYIRFLFPESILNVKAHKNIRRYILEKTRLIKVTSYGGAFSGVTTKYIDIACSRTEAEKTFIFEKEDDCRTISVDAMFKTDNLVFNFMDENEISIVNLVKSKGAYSLNNSIWALGIVTGDNKNKLLSSPSSTTEEIYTGKDIKPYLLAPAHKYIVYNRNSFQQVAKDEIYRAKEKLVYKFISDRLVFAYDNQQRLFLNSANILIPNIPGMSIKTVAAFLNSTLFQFLYAKMFGEVKVLKGNLIELPFPMISEDENEYFEGLVDRVLTGDTSSVVEIDNRLFHFYGLSTGQVNYIRSVQKWKN